MIPLLKFLLQQVLWLSRKTVAKLESVENRNPEILKFTRNFKETTEYFKTAINKKFQVYKNVHSFYQTSEQVSQIDLL